MLVANSPNTAVRRIGRGKREGREEGGKGGTEAILILCFYYLCFCRSPVCCFWGCEREKDIHSQPFGTRTSSFRLGTQNHANDDCDSASFSAAIYDPALFSAAIYDPAWFSAAIYHPASFSAAVVPKDPRSSVIIYAGVAAGSSTAGDWSGSMPQCM